MKREVNDCDIRFLECENTRGSIIMYRMGSVALKVESVEELTTVIGKLWRGVAGVKLCDV